VRDFSADFWAASTRASCAAVGLERGLLIVKDSVEDSASPDKVWPFAGVLGGATMGKVAWPGEDLRSDLPGMRPVLAKEKSALPAAAAAAAALLRVAEFFAGTVRRLSLGLAGRIKPWLLAGRIRRGARVFACGDG